MSCVVKGKVSIKAYSVEPQLHRGLLAQLFLEDTARSGKKRN